MSELHKGKKNNHPKHIEIKYRKPSRGNFKTVCKCLGAVTEQKDVSLRWIGTNAIIQNPTVKIMVWKRSLAWNCCSSVNGEFYLILNGETLKTKLIKLQFLGHLTISSWIFFLFSFFRSGHVYSFIFFIHILLFFFRRPSHLSLRCVLFKKRNYTLWQLFSCEHSHTLSLNVHWGNQYLVWGWNCPVNVTIICFQWQWKAVTGIIMSAFLYWANNWLAINLTHQIS